MRIFFAMLLLPLAGLAQEKTFELKGTLQLPQRPEKAYIQYANGEEGVRDSVLLNSNNFSYTGKITEPTLASVRLAYPKAAGESRPRTESLIFFVEPGTTTFMVKDTVAALTVKGNKAHADYQALVDAQKPYRTKLTQLYADWSRFGKEANKEAQQKVEGEIEALEADMQEKANKAFLQKNPRSPVALYALSQYAGYDIDADKVVPLFEALPAETRALPSAVAFAERLEIAKKIGIGKVAMDFTQADTSGKMVSLSDFRGKYVLIDFWASWCGPCRVENPNVVAVYNQYKDRGFTVLGVSLDREGQRDRWLKAIYDDKLTWTHVSDLKFWENAAAQQYGIRAIPMNLLVDPKGVIIAKNVRGEDLGKTVEKALAGNRSVKTN